MKTWLKQINTENINNIISQIITIIVVIALLVLCLNLINKFVPKIINYVFNFDTSSENLPTCPNSEKVIIGYRNGKPMKICDQTYTFIFQDWNYSCMLTGNKDSGALGFARGVGKSFGLDEATAIKTISDVIDTTDGCDLGRLSPEWIQQGYTEKGDGSILTHTKTLGF